tara:strand:+ start:577 stop:981 length:405 start_codon:yes stop_codon:yes gene_type:complete
MRAYLIKNIYKFVIFLILIPGISFSEWVKINYKFSGTNDSHFYWNKDLEYIEKDIVRFYKASNYDPYPIAGMVYSSMANVEIDCVKGLSRELSYINYSDYNLKGDIIMSSQEIDNWIKINFDGSVMSEMSDILC